MGPMALDDPRAVDARRQRSERAPAVAIEARSAERVRDRRIAVTDEDRGLERDRHPLYQPACAKAATSPPADSTSPKNASTDSGERTIPRSTSRQLTLPEPSQIELSGASR